MHKKVIRAIDPGPVKSAMVDWDGEKIINALIFNNDDHAVIGGTSMIKTDGNVIVSNGIYSVVIEMVACYGMPVGAEVFETAVWIGRFYEQYESNHIRCSRITRNHVKLHICKNARANDSTITTAIIDRFDPLKKFGKHGKGTKKNPGMFYGFKKDIWQAFALALTAHDMSSMKITPPRYDDVFF